MKKELDIHDYPKKVEQSVNLVKRSDISPRNKKLILDFREFCSMEGMSLARIARYMGILKDWARILKKDFDKATKEDIMKAVRVVQGNNRYSAWTKATYKIMIKRFFRWLKKTGLDQPEEVKWINTNVKRTDRKLISNGELLTEDEVRLLVNTAEHPRDKAFIATLYESGARIGELATLQLENIKIDEYGAILNVTGKTGPRQIRIISSVPYLVTWLQNHPYKDNNKAALWINIGCYKHHDFMKYSNIRFMLMHIFKKAGIKKRFNPHIFRHSRTTFLADHLTEFQMNQYFGWIQGSKMPSTYVHMSGKKIDASILALNGITQPKESKESHLKPKICPRCDTINAVDAHYCIKCAGILDIKTACEMEQKIREEKEARAKADTLLNLLVKDSEFMKLVEERIKELDLGKNVSGVTDKK